MLYLDRIVEESFKKFLDPDPEANNIQNLMSSFHATDTSVVNFQDDLFSSFYVKLLTDRQRNRQTDRQITNAEHYITSLAKVIIFIWNLYNVWCDAYDTRTVVSLVDSMFRNK